RTAGSAHALDRRLHRPRFHRPRHPRAVEHGDPAHHAVAGHEDRAAVLLPALQSRRAPVRLGRAGLPVPGTARAHGVPLPPQLQPHPAGLMADELPALDRALAEPRHLLVLSAEVAPEEVEALALSHFDDAGWLGPSTLRLTGEVQLTGPWHVDDRVRAALDLPPWAATAMLLRCPVQRGAPVPPELRGLGGLLDAFPEGEPVGLERRVLDHLLAQARRLAGALRVSGTGTVLVPDPASAVDLTVHTTVWLQPEACGRVLAPVLPGVVALDVPEAPVPPADRLRADVSPQRARAVDALDDGERAWLHAEADALDAAVLAQPQVVDGYAHLAPVPGGTLEVLVAGDEHTPLV